MNNTQHTVGAKLTNASAFTSPIGAWFRAGEVFTIESVGTVNTRVRHDRTGSVVYVSDGIFLTKDREWVSALFV